MASEVSQIVPRDILMGSRKAHDRDMAKSWKPGVKRFPAETEPFQRSGPLRGQQEVSVRELIEQEPEARRGLEIACGDRYALGETAVPTRAQGLQRIALGRLDLRHAGTELPQPLDRHRSRHVQREGDHAGVA